MRKLSALVLLLVVVLPQLSSAQPLVQGIRSFQERGIGHQYSIQGDDDVIAFTLALGFVTKSYDWELGLLYNRTIQDVGDNTKHGIGVYSMFYPIIQDEEIPITLISGGTFTLDFFTGERASQLEDAGIDLNSTTSQYFLGINHAYASSDVFTIIPQLILGYATIKATASGFGQSETATINGFFTTLSAKFVILRNGRPISVMPRLMFINDNTVVGLSVAFGSLQKN